jgi:hypothetical protein
MIDPEDPVVRRKNFLWGWGLVGLAAVLFAGTFGIALLYLALD